MGRAVPTGKITLDKERTMRLDMNAMELFEEHAGKQLHEMGETPSVKDMKILCWSMLVDDDENITLQEVGRHLHPGNMAAITDMIGKND